MPILSVCMDIRKVHVQTSEGNASEQLQKCASLFFSLPETHVQLYPLLCTHAAGAFSAHVGLFDTNFNLQLVAQLLFSSAN